MNQNGNVMKAMIGGILFIFGMLIQMVMWSPLVAFVLPYLDNAETIAMGGVVKAIILLIPAIVAFVGVVILVSEALGGNQPPQYYG